MTIRRRWIARCDAPACLAFVVLESDRAIGKWELGDTITDQGWDVGPTLWENTYCPNHRPEGER